jgi:hypothetical protein
MGEPTTPTGKRLHDDAWDPNDEERSEYVQSHAWSRERCQERDGCRTILAIEAEAAQQERERLRPWLKHHSDCYYLDGSKCRCGLLEPSDD